MSRFNYLLINGHGIEDQQNCSPFWSTGKRLYEWEFTRQIVSKLSRVLTLHNIDHIRLVDEDTDVPLEERARRANLFPADKSIVIDIHANAGGGRGFEIFTSKGETRADHVADVFADALKKVFPEIRFRSDYSDGDSDKEKNWYILKHTAAPAILIELLFMDNQRECQILQMTEEGQWLMVTALFMAIKNIELRG